MANKEIISESDMGIIRLSGYHENKRMAETILKSYYIQNKISFNTLRIAYTYGPAKAERPASAWLV